MRLLTPKARNLAVVLVAYAWSAHAGTNTFQDLSTPVNAFRSMGQALAARNPEAAYSIFPSTTNGAAFSYEDFLEKVWRGDGWRILVPETTDEDEHSTYAGRRPEEYFLQAQPVEAVLTNSGGFLLSFVLLRWDEGKVLKREVFVRQGDTWKWAMTPVEDTYPLYGYSTPGKAYLTVSSAARAKSVKLVCEGVASPVRASLTLDQYVEAVKKRVEGLSSHDRTGLFPSFVTHRMYLEEEMLENAGTQPVCRVWEHSATPSGPGQRCGFKTFMKEGDEWKWVPDENSIWYPAKPEQKAGE